LQWGKQDTLSRLSSALDDPSISKTIVDPLSPDIVPNTKGLPPLPSHAPPYFTVHTPSEFISIIQNDWPYSGTTSYVMHVKTSELIYTPCVYVVPADVEHTLIWTRVPIFHEDIVDSSIRARVEQDGLWGFTGSTSPPPSPSRLPLCLPALAEWGLTAEKMITSPKGTAEQDALVQRAGKEVHEFVKARWAEDVWETAWFVNPPVWHCLFFKWI
jgi:hypothetical protein